MQAPLTRTCRTCGAVLLPRQRRYCSRACNDYGTMSHSRVADPTPLQIAIRSAQIRATWDDETRRRRAGAGNNPEVVIQAFCRDSRSEVFEHDGNNDSTAG